MTPPDPGQREIGKFGRHIITISHHTSYLLSILFPRKIGSMFVIGYPKSGTVWGTQMIADYLELPFADLSFFPIGFPSVLHGHYRVNSIGPKVVYVIRDGRDAMVSMYFYLARQIPKNESPIIPKYLRRYFKGIKNINEIKSNLPLFIEEQCRRPVGSRVNWSQHVLSIHGSKRLDIPVMRYEKMVTDCENELASAVYRLTGRDVNVDRLKATVNKYSFKQQTGRKIGVEDRKSFLRKGVAGDWKNHFTKESAEIFNKYCGDALIKNGYELDDSWVSSIGN